MIKITSIQTIKNPLNALLFHYLNNNVLKLNCTQRFLHADLHVPVSSVGMSHSVAYYGTVQGDIDAEDLFLPGSPRVKREHDFIKHGRGFVQAIIIISS
jgi:hypothetical protein